MRERALAGPSSRGRVCRPCEPSHYPPANQPSPSASWDRAARQPPHKVIMEEEVHQGNEEQKISVVGLSVIINIISNIINIVNGGGGEF